MPDHSSRFSFAQNTPRSPCGERGAKNDIRFLLRQDPCKAGLMQQAEQGICKQTLCSWHTRGVLSRTLAGALVSHIPLRCFARNKAPPGKWNQIELVWRMLYFSTSPAWMDAFLRFVPLHCAVTAGTGQPPSCIVGL